MCCMRRTLRPRAQSISQRARNSSSGVPTLFDAQQSPPNEVSRALPHSLHVALTESCRVAGVLTTPVV